MSRRHKAQKRELIPDPRFGDAILAKFINSLMNYGKKKETFGRGERLSFRRGNSLRWQG